MAQSGAVEPTPPEVLDTGEQVPLQGESLDDILRKSYQHEAMSDYLMAQGTQGEPLVPRAQEPAAQEPTPPDHLKNMDAVAKFMGVSDSQEGPLESALKMAGVYGEGERVHDPVKIADMALKILSVPLAVIDKSVGGAVTKAHDLVWGESADPEQKAGDLAGLIASFIGPTAVLKALKGAMKGVGVAKTVEQAAGPLAHTAPVQLPSLHIRVGTKPSDLVTRVEREMPNATAAEKEARINELMGIPKEENLSRGYTRSDRSNAHLESAVPPERTFSAANAQERYTQGVNDRIDRINAANSQWGIPPISHQSRQSMPLLDLEKAQETLRKPEVLQTLLNAADTKKPLPKDIRDALSVIERWRKNFPGPKGSGVINEGPKVGEK